MRNKPQALGPTLVKFGLRLEKIPGKWSSRLMSDFGRKVKRTDSHILIFALDL